MKGILLLLLFREMFHNAFPKFRVDLGKPLLILAAKNEDSLKILLPGLLGDHDMGKLLFWRPREPLGQAGNLTWVLVNGVTAEVDSGGGTYRLSEQIS